MEEKYGGRGEADASPVSGSNEKSIEIVKALTISMLFLTILVGTGLAMFAAANSNNSCILSLFPPKVKVLSARRTGGLTERVDLPIIYREKDDEKQVFPLPF